MQITLLQTVGGYSAEGDTGGGVLHLISLALDWTSAGNDVRLVTNSRDKGKKQYDGLAAVHRIPSWRLPELPSPLYFFMEMILNHPVQRRALGRLAGTLQKPTSVILSISPYPSDVLAAMHLSRRLGIPAVVYFHHLNPPPWWHPQRRGNVARLTADWLLTLFALTLAKIGGLVPALDQPSEVERAGWKFPEVMRDSHFLGVNDRAIARGTHPLYAACFIGRVAPSKGVIDLLHVWHRVAESFPTAKLVIAGKSQSARFERRLTRTIHRLDLQNLVERRGFITTREKRRLLSQSELFIFPSYEEGWSLSVMEAALYGTVPLVYDLPAYGYLDCSDIRVPVGDVHALADLATSLLKDPTRTAQIANHLKSRVTRYERKSIAESQIDYLRQLYRPRGRTNGMSDRRQFGN